MKQAVHRLLFGLGTSTACSELGWVEFLSTVLLTLEEDHKGLLRSIGVIMYGTNTAGGDSAAPSTAFILESICSPHPGAGIGCLPSSSSFQWHRKQWAPQLSAFSADTEERDSFP